MKVSKIAFMNWTILLFELSLNNVVKFFPREMKYLRFIDVKQQIFYILRKEQFEIGLFQYLTCRDWNIKWDWLRGSGLLSSCSCVGNYFSPVLFHSESMAAKMSCTVVHLAELRWVSMNMYESARVSIEEK